jgi:hypothetical protein
MKSIKILSAIIIFIIFGNIINANTVNYQNSQKEKNFKSILGFWKARQITKYKYLAPIFPEEIPAEESINVFFKSILSPKNQINDDNNESTENYRYLAPVFIKEIPVEEEISIFSTDTPNTLNVLNFESLTIYKNLAPVFRTEIPIEE